MGIKEAYNRIKASLEAEAMLFRKADEKNDKRMRQLHELSMRRITECMLIIEEECPEVLEVEE